VVNPYAGYLAGKGIGLGLREEDKSRRESFGGEAAPKLSKPPAGLQPSQGSVLPAGTNATPQPEIESENLGLRAVGAVGNLLDLPGSMVRDTLTLNNPFDQLLSPFSSENRVHGDAFRQSFLPGEGTTTSGKVGRFLTDLGIEIALDPLTYLSGGITAAVKGSSRGAQAARAALKTGLVDDLAEAGTKKLGRKVGKKEALQNLTAQDLIDFNRQGLDSSGRKSAGLVKGKKAKFDKALDSDKQLKKQSKEINDAERSAIANAPLSQGHYRFRLPFGIVDKSFGGAKAARFSDAVGSAVRYSAPVRVGAALVHKPSKGRLTKAGQIAGAEEARRLAEDKAAVGYALQPAIANIKTKVFKDGLPPDEQERLGSLAYDYLEDVGRGGADQGEGGIRQFSPDDGFRDRAEFGELREAGVLEDLDVIKEESKIALDHAQRSGVAVEMLDDPFISYAARTRNASDSPMKRAESQQVYETKSEHATRRRDYLRGHEGGTGILQKMSLNIDPATGRKLSPDEGGIAASADNAKEAGTQISKDLAEARKQKFAEVYNVPEEKVDSLYTLMANRPLREIEEGKPLFVSDPTDSAFRAIGSLYEAAGEASGLSKFLKKHSQLPQSVELNRLVSEASDTDFVKSVEDRGRAASALRLQADILEQMPEGADPALRRLTIQNGGDRDKLMQLVPGTGDDLPPGGGGSRPSGGGGSRPSGGGGGGGGGGGKKPKPGSPSPSSSVSDEAVQAAKDLLRAVDEGGVPSGMNNNLRKVGEGVLGKGAYNKRRYPTAKSWIDKIRSEVEKVERTTVNRPPIKRASDEDLISAGAYVAYGFEEISKPRVVALVRELRERGTKDTMKLANDIEADYPDYFRGDFEKALLGPLADDELSSTATGLMMEAGGAARFGMKTQFARARDTIRSLRARQAPGDDELEEALREAFGMNNKIRSSASPSRYQESMEDLAAELEAEGLVDDAAYLRGEGPRPGTTATKGKATTPASKVGAEPPAGVFDVSSVALKEKNALIKSLKQLDKGKYGGVKLSGKGVTVKSKNELLQQAIEDGDLEVTSDGLKIRDASAPTKKTSQAGQTRNKLATSDDKPGLIDNSQEVGTASPSRRKTDVSPTAETGPTEGDVRLAMLAHMNPAYDGAPISAFSRLIEVLRTGNQQHKDLARKLRRKFKGEIREHDKTIKALEEGLDRVENLFAEDLELTALRFAAYETEDLPMPAYQIVKELFRRGDDKGYQVAEMITELHHADPKMKELFERYSELKGRPIIRKDGKKTRAQRSAANKKKQAEKPVVRSSEPTQHAKSPRPEPADGNHFDKHLLHATLPKAVDGYSAQDASSLVKRMVEKLRIDRGNAIGDGNSRLADEITQEISSIEGRNNGARGVMGEFEPYELASFIARLGEGNYSGSMRVEWVRGANANAIKPKILTPIAKKMYKNKAKLSRSEQLKFAGGVNVNRNLLLEVFEPNPKYIKELMDDVKSKIVKGSKLTDDEAEFATAILANDLSEEGFGHWADLSDEIVESFRFTGKPPTGKAAKRTAAGPIAGSESMLLTPVAGRGKSVTKEGNALLVQGMQNQSLTSWLKKLGKSRGEDYSQAVKSSVAQKKSAIVRALDQGDLILGKDGLELGKKPAAAGSTAPTVMPQAGRATTPAGEIKRLYDEGLKRQLEMHGSMEAVEQAAMESGFSDADEMLQRAAELLYARGQGESLSQSTHHYGRVAGTRVGLSDSGVLAGLTRAIFSDDYVTVYGTAARDIAAALQLDRQLGERMVDVFNSSRPEVSALRSSIKPEFQGQVEQALRLYDEQLAEVNQAASLALSDDAILDVASSLDMDMPALHEKGSEAFRDHFLKHANTATSQGKTHQAQLALSVANPLHDDSDRLLGSFSMDSYPAPEAIAKFANNARNVSYEEEYGYTTLEALLNERPEVFTEMVADAQAVIGRDSSINFGNAAPQYTKLPFAVANASRQRGESLAQSFDYDPNFYVKSLKNMEARKPNSKVTANEVLKRSQNPLGLSASEIDFLKLEEAFAGKDVITAGELASYIDSMSPKITVRYKDGPDAQYQQWSRPAEGAEKDSYFELHVASEEMTKTQPLHMKVDGGLSHIRGDVRQVGDKRVLAVNEIQEDRSNQIRLIENTLKAFSGPIEERFGGKINHDLLKAPATEIVQATRVLQERAYQQTEVLDSAIVIGSRRDYGLPAQILNAFESIGWTAGTRGKTKASLNMGYRTEAVKKVKRKSVTDEPQPPVSPYSSNSEYIQAEQDLMQSAMNAAENLNRLQSAQGAQELAMEAIEMAKPVAARSELMGPRGDLVGRSFAKLVNFPTEELLRHIHRSNGQVSDGFVSEIGELYDEISSAHYRMDNEVVRGDSAMSDPLGALLRNEPGEARAEFVDDITELIEASAGIDETIKRYDRAASAFEDGLAGQLAKDGADWQTTGEYFRTERLPIEGAKAEDDIYGDVFLHPQLQDLANGISDREEFHEGLTLNGRSLHAALRAGIELAVKNGLDGVTVEPGDLAGLYSKAPSKQQARLKKIYQKVIKQVDQDIKQETGTGSGFTRLDQADEYTMPEAWSPSNPEEKMLYDEIRAAGIGFSEEGDQEILEEFGLPIEMFNRLPTVKNTKQRSLANDQRMALMFTDELKQSVRTRGQSLFQAGNTGENRAEIVLPRGVSKEDWMEANVRTEINALKEPDVRSLMHELGHLTRFSLKRLGPEKLEKAQQLMKRYVKDPGTEMVDGEFNWNAQALQPNGVDPMSKGYTLEEAFADIMMQVFDKRSDRRALSPEDERGFLAEITEAFRDLTGGIWSKVKDTAHVEEMQDDVVKFIEDDILGPEHYYMQRPSNIAAILDATKSGNIRMMNRILEELDSKDISNAESQVLRKRFDGAKKASGKFDEVEQEKFAQIQNEYSRRKDVVVSEFLAENGRPPSSVELPALMRKDGDFDGIDMGVSPKEVLSQFKIDQSLQQDFSRIMNTGKQVALPGVLNKALSYFDAVTNTFKTNVTATNPGFHGRNFISGFIQNVLNDVTDPNLKGINKFLRPIRDARDLMTGQSVKGLADQAPMLGFAKGQDAEASEELVRLAYAHGVLESPGQQYDMLGSSGQYASDTMPGLDVSASGAKPGKFGLFDIIKRRAARDAPKKRSENLNIFKVSGGFSGNDKFYPARLGRAGGDVIEGFHRLGGFTALIKQGYSPYEAAKRIKLLHVDYGNLTDVERNVLRRAFPFYSYTKGMTSYLVQELYNKPGGKVSQTVRAANISRKADPAVPDYVSQGVSIPLGEKPDGTKAYISGLGLMHEQPVSLLDPVLSGDVPESLFEIGRNLHPVLKAPLELMFNESMFQQGPQGGRSLDDLDPPLGRMLSNVGDTLGLTDRTEPYRINKVLESVASNSPASRYISTARTLADPRKTLGQKLLPFGLGPRVSTISPASQDAVLRERAAQLMREMGGKVFERSYIPDETIDAMSPADREKAESYMQIMKTLADRAKHRKAVTEMQQAQETN